MENNLSLATSCQLTICPHPFSMNRVISLIRTGLTIQEILDSIEDLPKECTTSIQVDGIPIYPDKWSLYRPSEGSCIAIRVVPMGGGDDKDPLRTFLFLAVMIGSFAVGGWVAGLKGSSAFLGSLAAAGTSMLGTLLINALCPPAASKITNRAGVNRDGVVNSITGARNQVNPFGPIPVLLGVHRIVPFYGARPYTEIQGNDQYLRLLFAPCFTPIILSKFRIGETDLVDFEDVEIEIKSSEDDADSTIYTNVVYEEALSINLLEVDGWTTRTTQADIDEIVVDLTCPTGLCSYNSQGDRNARIVDFEVQYAIKDSGVWVELYAYFHFDTQDVGPITASIYPAVSSLLWRIIINPYTGVASAIRGIDGLTNQWTSEELYASLLPVPGWACPLAKISRKSTLIVTGDITDERSACLDIENVNDFLVTAKEPASEYVNVAAGDLRINPNITGQTNEVVRKSIRISVPNDQYDVRIRRVTADTSSATVFDDLYWTTLRSITFESPVTKDNVATVALRFKATDQLNGIIDTFNFVGMSICKDWDANALPPAWVEQPTANPASLYRYVLQHPANKRAVADEKIDLVKLQEWHAFCQPTEANPNVEAAVNKGGGKVGIPCTDQPFVTDEAIYIIGSVAYDSRYTVDATSSANEIVIVATYAAETFTGEENIHTVGLQYNALIDYQSSVPEILQQIAAVGFASPTYVDGKYSVIIDQVQTTPIQHFTPRNSWGFSGSRSYPKKPHALRIIFANCLTDWEIDERVVYADGYTEETAILYEQLELPGVTDPDLAYVLGRYHLATLELRPERYSFYADVENLVATRGDLIRVTHDVPLWGVATGRIKSITDNGTHATAVVMDSIMTMVAEHSYSIRFRLSDGSTLLAAVNIVAGDQTTLTFTDPILLASAPAVDDLGLFGETGSESVELLIASIEPGEELSARIICVDYDAAVYTAVTLPISEHGSYITAPYSDVGKVGIPEIYQIRSDESVLYRGTDGSLQPRIVITLVRVSGYIDKIAYTEVNYKVYETDETWKTVIDTRYQQEPSIRDVEEGVTYTIRIRYILHSGLPTAWCDEVQHTVIGKTTAPPIPTDITATGLIKSIRLQWTNPAIVDFHSVGIWRALIDSFPGGAALYAVTGQPGAITSFVDRAVEYDTKYYYWLKSYDTAGNASDESASVNATPIKIVDADILEIEDLIITLTGCTGSYETGGIVFLSCCDDEYVAPTDDGSDTTIDYATPATVTIQNGCAPYDWSVSGTGYSIDTDTDGKTFDHDDLNVTTNRITLTAHGLGDNGAYIYLKYIEGTGAITGMTNETVYQFRIINVDTIEIVSADPTVAGAGTGHILAATDSLSAVVSVVDGDCGVEFDVTCTVTVTDVCGNSVELLLRHTDGVWEINWTSICSEEGGNKTGYAIVGSRQWQLGWVEAGSCVLYETDPECTACGCYTAWITYIQGAGITTNDEEHDDCGSCDYECRHFPGEERYKCWDLNLNQLGYPTSIEYKDWVCP